MGVTGTTPVGGVRAMAVPTAAAWSAEGQADRPERRDEPVGLAGVGGDQVRQALRQDTAQAGSIPAEEPPDRELEMSGARPRGEIRQAALVTAMDGGGGEATEWAGRSWGSGGELEPYGGLLHGTWESRTPCMGGNRMVAKGRSALHINPYNTAMSLDSAPAHQN
jgi:hypothetical protein